VLSRDGCQRLGEVQLQNPEGDALQPDRTSALRGRIDPFEILHLEIDDVRVLAFRIWSKVASLKVPQASPLSLALGPKLVVGILSSREEPDAVGQFENFENGDFVASALEVQFEDGSWHFSFVRTLFTYNVAGYYIASDQLGGGLFLLKVPLRLCFPRAGRLRSGACGRVRPNRSRPPSGRSAAPPAVKGLEAGRRIEEHQVDERSRKLGLERLEGPGCVAAAQRLLDMPEGCPRGVGMEGQARKSAS